MEKSAQDTSVNKYNFEVLASPEEAVGKIVKKEADIAAVATNLASTLYKKTEKGVTLLAVNTLGVLSILENGETVSDISDLKGKEIYSTGKGANPEYILRHVLSENSINPDKDVTLNFVQTNDELVSLMASGKAKVAMVAEPAATTVMTKIKTVRRVLNMTDEWGKIEDSGSLMMGCVIVRNEFLNENKEAVNKFLKEYKESILATESNIDETAALCEKYGIIPAQTIAKKAIPECNVVYIDKTEMKQQLSGYLKVLYAANPSSVGGELPDDNFYYIPQ